MDTLAEKTYYTPADLLAMPNAKLYELVNGQLVEQEMSLEASAVALRLGGLLIQHVEEHELGGVFESEASFQCFPDAPTKVRRPDVSFIARSRLREDMMQGHCPIAPDLAVEVVSPGDLLYEVYEKVEEYRIAGVRLIRVLIPPLATVQVFRQGEPMIECRAPLELSGDPVIPGFRTSLDRIFRRLAMSEKGSGKGTNP